MPNPIKDKTIVLGVTGSIAAYKAAEIASKLHQQGAKVPSILTEGSLHFISPLTFQSVTGDKSYTDADLWGGEGHVTHIGLGRAADLLLIAPVSANTLARLAHGLGDNLLSVTALASHCPLVLAPAMDSGMYDHPATQENVEILRQRGAIFIGPESGHLASGLIGPGRMSEPQEIVNGVRWVLGKTGPLAGKEVIVTAGGTQEPIDPVRIITNRSSGKQGYALAQAALDAQIPPDPLLPGHSATALCAVTAALPGPVGSRVTPTRRWPASLGMS
jgi:phosphopantothenoylcysteine decarboxylase/phosphopantothenate--cysteine ligase